MQGRTQPAPPSAANAPVVIKQVSLERMAAFMHDHPQDGHTPDNPIVEKEVGDIVRAAGGHPNLVQYTDSFVEQQTLYLVMEHCADGDMYDYLSSGCTTAGFALFNGHWLQRLQGHASGDVRHYASMIRYRRVLQARALRAPPSVGDTSAARA
ncbi:hypothetical protein PR003_g24031 [Phytophthora rubi]|nr:hypothetical protein PR002_g27785 [Phytophthora rubi]KAE9295360.1 hypothetical protein PR003_g24031 [Phytophthora rubi]